jgi:predicted transcriptional regulator
MTPVEKLRVIRPEDDLLVALRSIDETSVAQLPVISGGELLGAVGRVQILRYLSARAELGM